MPCHPSSGVTSGHRTGPFAIRLSPSARERLRSARRCRRDRRLLERQAGDRLGHTWRLERKSIPRRVDRDFTHQGRPRLLCEGQDLVLIACPPRSVWLLPPWVTVQVNVPSGLIASAMDVFWFGLAHHWPCRFCGGAGGGGTSSAVRDSPSAWLGGCRRLRPGRDPSALPRRCPRPVSCAGAWEAGEPWHRGPRRTARRADPSARV